MGIRMHGDNSVIILTQSGRGIPVHMSPKATLYFDIDSAKAYINKDGLNTWAALSDSSVSSGISGFTYNNLNNTFTIVSSDGYSYSASLNEMSGLTVNGNINTQTLSAITVTAGTVVNVNYIDFNTGSTVSPKAGRIHYNKNTHDFSYYSDINTGVTINPSQQQYIVVHNGSGALIQKGKALKIQSATNGLPNVTLAIAAHSGNNQVVGLAAADIQNNGFGLALADGILSGLTLNTYNYGDILYLSDTIPGDLIASTSSLNFSARTNQVGYVIATGSTTGAIYVSINNEDINLTLTDKERNILEGNVASTGVYEFTGITKTSNTTFNVAPMKGWIVYNTYAFATLPDVKNIIYSGATGVTTPFLTTAESTYVLVNSASTLVLQSTFPTPQERRENIFLGKVVHPNKLTIQNVNNTVDFDVSPMSAIRDLWTPLKLINQGLVVSPNGANLNINISSGALWGNGIGWVANQLNPDSVNLSAQTPSTFQYRTQTGGTFSDTTTVDTTQYDVNGVATPIPGSGNYTTQRIYAFPTGVIRIQYGQSYYPTLSKALAEIQNENFIQYPTNRDNGILIGLLTVSDGATDLSKSTDAVFSFVSKFGELLGGTGGLSTTTLQGAYDNSTEPEIVTNSTLDGLTIRRGSASDNDFLIQFQSGSGTTRASIDATGLGKFTSLQITGLTSSANTRYLVANSDGTITYRTDVGNFDVFVTGGTYNVVTGAATFTNNTGGTFSVYGFNSNTGSTAPTIANFTYNSSTNTFTITDSTGHTFNAIIQSVSGLTVNGILSASTISGGTFYGNGSNLTNVVNSITVNSGLSANSSTGNVTIINTAPDQIVTITGNTNVQVLGSYPNFGIKLTGLTDVFVTGASYNNTTGIATFTNNTGGTFTVNGFYTGNTDVFVTGGTYANGTATFRNNTGGTFTVIGFYTGNTDVFVTGASYNNITGIATFTNNTGGTFNVIGFTTPFTGGTITGSTFFSNGLSANTISATTYLNLPLDVTLTGGTYSSGTATFTNNTGGTFSVSGFTTPFTGGTVTGATLFNNGLSASTISATTYLNLPLDIRVTGGTYSAGTAVFTNNTGGTFNVTGLISANTFTTGATLSGSTVYFNRNDALSAYSVNLSALTPVTLYTGNGILTSNRVVGLNSTSLTISGTTSTRFNSSGNVSIGSTADTGEKLYVRGNVSVDTSGIPIFISSYYPVGSTGYNIFIGNGGINSVSGTSNASSYNTALGYNTLLSNNSGKTNTAVGYNAMYFNTDGYSNIAVGGYSLQNNTTGYNNVSVGVTTLVNNTTGYGNTAVGNGALWSHISGNGNIALGSDSMYNNISGVTNIGIGIGALRYTTGGLRNIAIGELSLANITNDNNIGIGYFAGYYNMLSLANSASTTSMYLGISTKAGSTASTNEIVIGYQAIGNGSNTVTLGNTSILSTILQGNVGVGPTSPTNKLHITAATDPIKVIGLQNSNTDNILVSVDTNGVLHTRAVSAITASTPTLYTSNGALLSNRVVNLSGYTLNFSSATYPNSLILYSGSVGINMTPSTTYALDVTGNFRASGSLIGANNYFQVYDQDSLYLGNSNVSGTTRFRMAGAAPTINFYNNGTFSSEIVSQSGRLLLYHSTGRVDLGLTNGISVFNSGRVGIGTTTEASYKLDVVGTARFQNNTYISGRTFIDQTGAFTDYNAQLNIFRLLTSAETGSTQVDFIRVQSSYHGVSNITLGTIGYYGFIRYTQGGGLFISNGTANTISISAKPTNAGPILIGGTGGTENYVDFLGGLSGNGYKVFMPRGIWTYNHTSFPYQAIKFNGVSTDQGIGFNVYALQDAMTLFGTSGNLGLNTTTDNNYRLNVKGNVYIESTANTLTIVGLQPTSDNKLLNIDATGGVHTIAVSAITSSPSANTYTTGATLSGTTLVFNRNDVSNAYNVNVSALTPVTLYTGNGTITGNRNVNLSSYYLDISGTTPTRFFNDGNVVIGSTANNGYRLNVYGKIGTTYSSQSAFMSTYYDSLSGGFGSNLYIGNGGQFSSSSASTTDGSTNTSVGIGALYFNTTGKANTAIGNNAMYYNTAGFYNVAVGGGALIGMLSGNSNVGVGVSSMLKNVAGVNNVAIGHSSLAGMTGGNGNIAVGVGAFSSTASTSGNIAIGDTTITALTAGTRNIALGPESLRLLSSGNQNIAIGWRSLYITTGGSSNIAIGTYAGFNTVDGVSNYNPNNNIFIGDGVLAATSADTNQIVIGNTAVGYGSNSVSLGNTSITKTILQGNVGMGPTAPTNKLHITATTNPIRIVGLQSGFDNILVSVDASGVLHTIPLSSVTTVASANTFTTAATLSSSTLYFNRNDALSAYSVNLSALTPTTLYTGDGVILSNRNVGLGSNWLTISGTTSTRFHSNGNVTIGATGDSGQKLYVKGNISVDTTGQPSLISTYHDSVNSGLGKNIFIGNGGLNSSSSGNVGFGSSNTSLGYDALKLNTLGYTNVAIGTNALTNNLSGFSNTAIGASSLQANTFGISNVAVGLSNLQNNTIGSYNTTIGQNALMYNITGSSNIAIGYYALGGASNTGSSTNIAIGDSTLLNNITGTRNISIGSEALRNNNVGSYNLSIGYRALYTNISGTSNIGIGTFAGNSASDGSNNISSSGGIYIGDSSTSSSSASTNEIVIGNSAVSYGSNSVTLGNTSITKTILQGNIGMGPTAPTNKLHVTAATDPIKVVGLQNSNTDNILVSVDTNGVLHTRAVSAITASTPTLYTSNGTLLSNRVVDITGNTLNFSSSTYPNVLSLNAGNVVIGAVSSTYKFDVNGNSRIQGDLILVDNSLTTTISAQTQANSNVLILGSYGSSGGFNGGFDFRSGNNGRVSGTTIFRIWGSNNGDGNDGRVGIGNLTEGNLQASNSKLFINNTFFGGRNSGIRLTPNSASTTEYNGIQFDYNYTDSLGGAFIGAQSNPLVNGYDMDLVVLNTMANANSYSEIARFVGKYSSFYVGSGRTNPVASAKLQVDSQNQGVLTPRMSSSNRIGITSPATGLLVYQTGGTEGQYVKLSSQWARFLTEVDATGFTSANTYTTGATLIGATVYFNRNDALSAYSVNLSALTGAPTTNTYTTGATYNITGGTFTFTRNDGFTYTAGTLSYVTGGTQVGNTFTLRENDGGTTIYTANAVTGGSFSNGVLTLSGTGTISNISGLTTTFTGGTVTGPTLFTNGLSANTISATTYLNLPLDIRVTGGTYSNSIATFTNNTGGTFNVTGFTTPFTGGTVTGSTLFNNGLSANTISATTYLNLPLDIRVTGGTYSSGTTTFTNNTGGTFNVTGFIANAATGGTYSNGVITLSGTGILSTITGLTSANTFTTGATLSGSTLYFNRNDALSAYSVSLSALSVTANTLYTGDGIILSNRNVGLSSYSLTISGTSSTRFHSDGNVSIGATGNTGHKLYVKGNISVDTNGQPALISTYYDSANSALGRNIFIGGGGLNSVSNTGITYLGSLNTSLGYDALKFNTTGNYNVAVGMYSLYTNVSGGSNTAIGAGALQSNTNGNTNIAVGSQALLNNFTGSSNIGIGFSALRYNISGNSNIAIGEYALGSAKYTAASENIGIGISSLNNMLTGTKNIGIGTETLKINETGSYNVAIGYRTFFYTLSATNNVAIGNFAGTSANVGGNNINGSYSIYIGDSVRSSASAATNEIAIGYLAIGNGSNTAILGSAAITATTLQGNVGIGTLTATNKLHVTASTNPVRIQGLQSASDNQLISIDSTGILHTIAVSAITAFTSADTYTTGATYNITGGTFTFTRNDGISYTAGTLNYVTGGTQTGNTFTLRENDGGITTYTANAVTGGSYSNGTLVLSGTGTISNITGLPTNFTGGTVNGATLFNNGLSANTISATTYLNLPLDIRVTGGSYNGLSGVATFTNNTGGTFNVTGFNTAVITGFTPSNYVVQGRLAANQSITGAGIDTIVQFIDDFDPQNWWNSSTYKFTPNIAGYYIIDYSVWWESFNTATGQSNAQARLNGNTFLIVQSPLQTNAGNSMGGTKIIYMNGTTDYIEFTVYQDSGTNKNIQQGTATGSGTWFSASLISSGPKSFDTFVTGGTYSNGTATFGNNSGNTFSVTGFIANAATGGTYSNGTITLAGTGTLSTITGLPTQFTGGTVTGATLFNNGLSANTMSATTYLNLPLDIRVTGGTYAAGTAIFTNNTGGTFNVTGFTTPFTGGTVTGSTLFNNGLSANTISATTYLNLPLDIRVTGGTYANGTAIFTNNTGGTFNVTGFTSANTFTTGATYNITGGTFTFTRNDGVTYTAGTLSYVTGGTQTGNTFTLRENDGGTTIYTANAVTGGSFSNGVLVLSGTGVISNISGLATPFTGGTVTGSTLFNNGLSANTISATTYLNLPLDIRVTGGTYATGTAVFTNNTGGTFNVTGFTTPFTGGTVTGATLFNNGLSANTISATTYLNLPLDIRVTGGTYATGTISFTNNTGGTFSVTGLTTPFTGGTVTGSTLFNNGLSANTISATTYLNLPLDIRVTGGTYSNSVATFTNNTGGTFNVTGFIANAATGGTYSNGTITLSGTGILSTITGLTSANTFTTGATLIGATVYFNRNDALSAYSVNLSALTGAPATNTYTTGATYNITGGTFVFTRNDGFTYTAGTLSYVTGGTQAGNTFTLRENDGGTTIYTANAVTGGSYSNGVLTLSGTGTISNISGLTTTFTGGTVTGATLFNNGLSANTISATTYLNLPLDIRVTGGTYSSGTAVFTNNTGGTFNVTGLTTPFTGGTVTGATLFNNGLSANTISATTYLNLPLDIRVTGGTYSNSVATFTNNTGGTFSVTGLTTPFTGGTVTGSTLFNNGLSANTMSATTYLNLPLDIRVTGGTYSNSIATFTNNTGGTFNVTGFTTPFTGGTVTGATLFNNGLSANTISATTYLNLPLDIRVTGGTYATGTISFTNNTGGTFNVTGLTSANTFTTGATLSGSTIYFNRNDALSAYSVSLSALSITANTIYTGDGTLSNNRNVNLGSNTLNFSSSTYNSNLILSGGSVGINTATPSASAALEIVSTSKGVLFPRMTEAQRILINAVTGLIVYQTDSDEGLYIYKSYGWVQII